MALPDYYPNYDQSKRTVVKVGVIIAVIITLVIICYAVFAFFFHMGKVKVEVIYAPHYAEVELNGKKVKNPSTHYLEPGEYEVKVWAPEFEEFSTKVQVDENTKYIYGSLNPATAKGEELSNDTLLDQFLEIEGIAGQVLAEEGERTLEKYPILSKLPYDTIAYSLGYEFKDYALTINMKNTTTYLDGAVNKLLSFAEETGRALAEYRVKITYPVAYPYPFPENPEKSDNKNPELFLQDIYGNVDTLAVHNGVEDEGYYYTVLTTGLAEKFSIVTYRVVLKKDGEFWELVGMPTPVVTTENMPGVPLEILNKLNEMAFPTEQQTECANGNCD